MTPRAAMRVIFLDVDGVLNSRERWSQLPMVTAEQNSRIDPLAVARLRRITAETGAVVVVSSSWRLQKMAPLSACLAAAGIQVVGRTPYDRRLPWRGDEIKAWLDQHPEVERYVILDDGLGFGMLYRHHVKTQWDTGLLDSHVDTAIEILRHGSNGGPQR